jgi:uncharacterized membrane protein YccF (DUF307 family)
MAIAWLVAGALMVVTIIDIPWARAAFSMTGYAFLPFCRRAMSRARCRELPATLHRSPKMLNSISPKEREKATRCGGVSRWFRKKMTPCSS